MKDIMELVLHPIRMRMIIALTEGPLTALQLTERLKDVPQATLYRHLNKLAQAELVVVVSERQVRGTLEKAYALNRQGPTMTPEEFLALSKEDHLRAFTAFTATLLDDFSRYIERNLKLDLIADGVGYHKIPLELNDEEFDQLAANLNAAILPVLNNPPAPGRKRRLFTTIMLPDPDAVPQESSADQPVETGLTGPVE